ncbi:phage major capsid protein, partial [Nostoc sp. 3335mG]
MYETKNDPLEASFAGADDIAELRAGMAELKAKLDAGTIAAARAPLSGASAPEAKQFVDRYLRHGNSAGIEVKAIDGTADSSGGYAVPQEIDAAIASTLTAISPIRAIANVVTVGSSGYRKLVTSGGISSGWAAENAARAETGTPVFNEIAPPMGDLFANPAATQAMLDDAAFDLEGWLAAEIATEFARAEGAAFVNGDGANKPKGFLQAPRASTGDDVRPFGTLQYLAPGVDGDFPASEPED